MDMEDSRQRKGQGQVSVLKLEVAPARAKLSVLLEHSQQGGEEEIQSERKWG